MHLVFVLTTAEVPSGLVNEASPEFDLRDSDETEAGFSNCAKGGVVDPNPYDSRGMSGIQAVIPGRSNRRIKIEHDRAVCKERYQIERLFERLEINSVIATRYDELAESFLCMIHISVAR